MLDIGKLYFTHQLLSRERSFEGIALEKIPSFLLKSASHFESKLDVFFFSPSFSKSSV